MTALLTTGAQDPPAADRLHAAPESVDLLAFAAIGLKGSFHKMGPAPLELDGPLPERAKKRVDCSRRRTATSIKPGPGLPQIYPIPR